MIGTYILGPRLGMFNTKTPQKGSFEFTRIAYKNQQHELSKLENKIEEMKEEYKSIAAPHPSLNNSELTLSIADTDSITHTLSNGSPPKVFEKPTFFHSPMQSPGVAKDKDVPPELESDHEEEEHSERKKQQIAQE